MVLATGAIAVATVAIADIRWPYSGDEKDYKWTAPLAWAHAHHFVRLPFRLSNGFNLAEYLSVPSATLHVLVVARFGEAALLIGLGLSAAALASLIGVGPDGTRWVGVALISMPIALLSAKQVGSDLAAAAFFVSAALAYLSLQGRPRLLLYGALTAAAALAKVILAPAALAMTIVNVVVFDGARGRVHSGRVALNCTGTAAALLAGFTHTFILTGHFVANNVRSLYPSGSPMLAAGAAAGRIPSLVDLVLVPVVPFLTGVIRQREPYGGRTGLPLLIGLPVVVALAVSSRSIPKGVLTMLVLGAATYVVLAPVFIKTRFLLMVWAFFMIASAWAVEELVRRDDRRRWIATSMVPAILLVSALDPIRVIFRTVR